MVAATLQLQSTGATDVFLTTKPEINIFKYTYFRYLNFATDTFEINLNQAIQFGVNKVTVDIPKKGHLLSKLYLRLSLPPLQYVDGTYVCWADALGYCLFSQPVELQIGGIIVDRLYPVCMDILDELSNADKRKGIDQMILKADIYRAAMHNAEKPTELMIPLDFWFTKQYSLALPLMSMTSQDVSLNFYIRPFGDLINYDGNIGALEPLIPDSAVYAEYIYLDQTILEQFFKQKHQYIIEQQFYNGDETILENQTLLTTKINFQNPCKELLFACVDNNNLSNNNYFNYGRRSDNLSLITDATLYLDGKHRFNNDFLPECMFRQYYPNSVHSVIPDKYLYVMPFSLQPEKNQPTGAINLQRYDEVNLALRMRPGNPGSQLYIFGIMYNVVTIENGCLKFEFMPQ